MTFIAASSLCRVDLVHITAQRHPIVLPSTLHRVLVHLFSNVSSNAIPGHYPNSSSCLDGTNSCAVWYCQFVVFSDSLALCLSLLDTLCHLSATVVTMRGCIRWREFLLLGGGMWEHLGILTRTCVMILKGTADGMEIIS